MKKVKQSKPKKSVLECRNLIFWATECVEVNRLYVYPHRHLHNITKLLALPDKNISHAPYIIIADNNY